MNRRILSSVLLTLSLSGCGKNDNSVSDICASVSNADNLLVDYRFGNQVTGSTLTITESGAVVRTERTCCPPVTTPITTVDVDSGTLSTLKSARGEIRGGHLVESVGTPTAEGSKAGELYVFEGNIRCLAKIQARGTVNDTIQSASTSSAVETVKAIVNTYVSEKMP